MVVLPVVIAAVPLLGVVTDVTESVSPFKSVSLATTSMSTATIHEDTAVADTA